MKPWILSLAKLCFGTYFVLTSLYCLLAFIPYTFSFLIKEPPSEALIAFTRYHLLLYWMALALGLIAYWEQRKKRTIQAAWIWLAFVGISFSATNFLPNIQNNWTAYAYGILTLLPLLLLACVDVLPPRTALDSGNTRASLLSYSNAVIVVLVVAAVSIAAVPIRNSVDANASGFWYGLLHIKVNHDLRTLEFMSLVLASYFWLALLIVSVVNLILMAATRISRRPEMIRVLTFGFLISAALFLSSYRFLQNVLDLRSWPALFYAVPFAVTLAFAILSILKPFFLGPGYEFSSKIAAWFLGLAFVCAALAVPAAIADRDWNGIAQNAFALLFWIVVCVSVYTLRPRSKSHSAAAIAATLLIAGFSYWGIKASAFLWARPVGTTDGAIERALETYATQNTSFNLVYHWWDGGGTETCEALCLSLRQYTNIRDAELKREVKLVDHLVPAAGARPNILIIVVDSMRPDYIGAYNPQADFTPNLDNFARDSVVMRNTYTPYAGTTLAEPCIWTGALLLHSHDLHPFEKVNTLERLLNADGYQMILSYDSVLRRTVSAADNMIKLDADKPWNRFEASSTFQQLESALDNRKNKEQPFFFYAQPMNVHQFGVNDLPKRTATNWKTRPGFSNNKAAFALHQVDESLGNLLHYLKTRGLYDNSIIIITADHGEGNEELGHHAHSTVIYPEVMHIPLIVHLPKELRQRVLYDENELTSLIDVAPSLYALLGHRPIEKGPLLGRQLFAETTAELQSYPRRDLLLASDVRAAYGLLSGDGHYMYVTYDAPPQSYLFDLINDPKATHSILTDESRAKYEQRLLEYLQTIADFYGYRPNGNRSLVAAR